MRDRGVALDSWDRNLKKTLGVPLHPLALTRLEDLIGVIFARNKPGVRRLSPGMCKGLASIRKFARRNTYPTERELAFVNRLADEYGLPRCSCPVRLFNKENALVALRRTEKEAAISNLASVQSNRPLRPPGAK